MSKQSKTDIEYEVNLILPDGEKIDPRRLQFKPIDDLVSAFAAAAMDAIDNKE